MKAINPAIRDSLVQKELDRIVKQQRKPFGKLSKTDYFNQTEYCHEAIRKSRMQPYAINRKVLESFERAVGGSSINIEAALDIAMQEFLIRYQEKFAQFRQQTPDEWQLL